MLLRNNLSRKLLSVFAVLLLTQAIYASDKTVDVTVGKTPTGVGFGHLIGPVHELTLNLNAPNNRKLKRSRVGGTGAGIWTPLENTETANETHTYKVLIVDGEFRDVGHAAQFTGVLQQRGGGPGNGGKRPKFEVNVAEINLEIANPFGVGIHEHEETLADAIDENGSPINTQFGLTLDATDTTQMEERDVRLQVRSQSPGEVTIQMATQSASDPDDREPPGAEFKIGTSGWVTSLTKSFPDDFTDGEITLTVRPIDQEEDGVLPFPDTLIATFKADNSETDETGAIDKLWINVVPTPPNSPPEFQETVIYLKDEQFENYTFTENFEGYTFTIGEGSQEEMILNPGAMEGIRATDPDEGDSESLEYAITSGNDDGHFRLEVDDSGYLRIVIAKELPLDATAPDHYLLTLEVRDGRGGSDFCSVLLATKPTVLIAGDNHGSENGDWIHLSFIRITKDTSSSMKVYFEYDRKLNERLQKPVEQTRNVKTSDFEYTRKEEPQTRLKISYVVIPAGKSTISITLAPKKTAKVEKTKSYAITISRLDSSWTYYIPDPANPNGPLVKCNPGATPNKWPFFIQDYYGMSSSNRRVWYTDASLKKMIVIGRSQLTGENGIYIAENFRLFAAFNRSEELRDKKNKVKEYIDPKASKAGPPVDAGVSINDIRQGENVYNCYFLAVLAAMAESRPHEIRKRLKVFKDSAGEEYVKAKFRNPNGGLWGPKTGEVYQGIQLSHGSAQARLRKDDDDKTNSGYGKNTEAWPIVYEQLYRQFMGLDYNFIDKSKDGHSPATVIRAFYGGCHHIYVRDSSGKTDLSLMSEKKFRTLLFRAMDNPSPIVVLGSRPNNAGRAWGFRDALTGKPVKIHKSHAYVPLKYWKKGGKTFLHMYNVHGYSFYLDIRYVWLFTKGFTTLGNIR